MVPQLLRKRILITGATGFIGANLVRYLVSLGISPYVTVRKDSNLWRIDNIIKRLKLRYVDLQDKEAVLRMTSLVRPNLIYHCATYGGYPFQSDSEKIIMTNMIGTANLLQACIKHGFDCFINTGTSSEYGIKQCMMKEADSLHPISEYGVSKASATLLCQALSSRHSIPIITLRPFSVYGYYEEKNRLIPSLIVSCLKGLNPELSSPRPLRDFVFIEDVLDAFMRVTQRYNKIKERIFNIGYGKQYSVGQITDTVIKLTGAKVKPLWGNALNPRIEPSKWVADISLAKDFLGWQPRHNLEEGLAKTINWFKDNLELYND